MLIEETWRINIEDIIDLLSTKDNIKDQFYASATSTSEWGAMVIPLPANESINALPDEAPGRRLPFAFCGRWSRKTTKKDLEDLAYFQANNHIIIYIYICNKHIVEYCRWFFRIWHYPKMIFFLACCWWWVWLKITKTIVARCRMEPSELTAPEIQQFA